MILDKNMMVADDLAHDGTPSEIDLGVVRPGPGNPIKMFIAGSSDLAACTGFVVVDGAATSPSDALLTQTCTLAGKTIEFELPSDVARFVSVDLVGTTTAGTWSCGVILPAAQTNT